MTFEEELDGLIYGIDNEGMEYTILNYSFPLIEAKYPGLKAASDLVGMGLHAYTQVIREIREYHDV